jgi:hypothetical protein
MQPLTPFGETMRKRKLRKHVKRPTGFARWLLEFKENRIRDKIAIESAESARKGDYSGKSPKRQKLLKELASIEAKLGDD